MVSAPIDDAVRAFPDPRRARRAPARSSTTAGAAVPSLISPRRSVPPAMTAVPARAWARIGGRLFEGRHFSVAVGDHFASFRFRAARTLRRRHGDLPDMDADGVVDGVGDRGRGRDARRLAQPLGPEVVQPLVDDVGVDRLDHRDVHGRGDLVVVQVGVDHGPGCRVHELLFEQPGAHALGDRRR